MLPQTLKVKGNKVLLVSKIFAQGLRYSLFPFFCQPRQEGANTKFIGSLRVVWDCPGYFWVGCGRGNLWWVWLAQAGV